ncbi:sortilin (neurotensin receptor 3) [Maribacter caenipelagi]|uniref:Sortilin (Neurotensin receptor 3) n=1 Tax=Maribacter caenipelagi TaxID=1447781 RepID=A0A4R7D3K9_9FLAO|nr:oxidoreductase [Maribacter caenipelagi]TDS15400.1 sortilin (neurotensin receptor 3) [Maribacter caenipelagi]
MRYTFLLIVIMISCSESVQPITFSSVNIETVYSDSLSIRAIELMGNSLAFGANKGTLGTIDLTTGKVRTNIEKYHTSVPAFRAVAHTSTDFFMLSIESPALLYKTGDNGRMELVYKEEGEVVFYDAMTFLNDKDGIAIGDSIHGCLSVIITSDGGKTWTKLPCSQLPEGIEGEGAFAASNTNIKTIDDTIWVATTSGRILFSSDKGQSWETYQTPITNAEPTEGIYSIDFYDKNLGFAIGGDYTNPNNFKANKAITKDGGKTWRLVADGNEPGYKSCVQFIPGTNGTGLVVVGFTGITYSSDMGESWKELSKESFYTIRFQNDSIAYAAGKNRISKLVFK